MPVFYDNSESIGRTPLVQINRITKGLSARVLAKPGFQRQMPHWSRHDLGRGTHRKAETRHERR